MKRLAGLLLLCAVAFPAHGMVEVGSVGERFTLAVSGDGHERLSTPVCVPLQVPISAAEVQGVLLQTEAGQPLVGQLTAPGLLNRVNAFVLTGHVLRELHFIVPRLGADETVSYKVDLTHPIKLEPGFTWTADDGKSCLLKFGERPVLQYQHAPLDTSSKQARFETYKVFHHLYSPDGDRLVTQGPGDGLEAAGIQRLYPHHRGIFYGFNKVTYGEGKKVDIWHCPVAYQQHGKFEEMLGGPVLGRQRAVVEWHGIGDEQFAAEERELTVYNTPGGTLLQFVSLLRANDGPIHLDGDPQHAGFHFRAFGEVNVNKAQTYYVRPDGKDQPGKTRNWSGGKGPINLPWDAMSFVIGGQRYTIGYLDHPDNPKESRHSERDYGRFGSYFVTDVTEAQPLRVEYRLWLQNGEMTVEQVAAKDTDFVTPPKVTFGKP